MNARIAFGILAALALGWIPVRGEGLVSGRAEHHLLVRIEGTPPGAVLCSIPEKDEQSIEIARLPYSAPIEFRWGRSWGVRRWRLMTASTVGDLARATFDPASNEWRVVLQFHVRAEGYQARSFTQEVCRFVRPSELDWDRLAGLPERVRMRVELDPAPAGPLGNQANDEGRVAGLVLMTGAGEAQEGTGLIELRAAAGQSISLRTENGRRVRLPVRVAMSAGEHPLTFYSDEESIPFERRVTVRAGMEDVITVEP